MKRLQRERHVTEGERRFFEFLGIPFPYIPPKSNYSPKTDQNKILVLADPHVPYEHEGALESALKSAHDARTVVIPGDLGDYYSKSRFKKTRHVSFKDEVRAIFYRLEWLSTHWSEIKVMVGNHDNRPEKTIGALFSNSTDLLIMTEPNLLSYIASWFDNVEMVGHRMRSLDLFHIYQLGDIVFTHGEISRVQKTATLEYISNYLHKWERTLGVKPWKVLAQAHNHQDLKSSRDGEKWFMLPTCSDPYSVGMEYIYSARMYGNPPSVGYSIFYQKDGITDYNKSHNVVIDYA